jgi:hypothetical protein
MASPTNLLRLVIEFVFILLGALLLWVGLSGHFLFGRFDRRSVLWIALGFVVLYAGVRALARAGRSAMATQDRIRGASFGLLGLMMLGVAGLPFGYVQPLLGAAGVVLILRGLASAVMVLRER